MLFKKYIIILFAFGVQLAFCQNYDLKKTIFKGVFKGQNLYLRNSFGSGGVGFCIKDIKVNKKGNFKTDASVVEIDFSNIDLKINDSVEIVFTHVDGCRPLFVNANDFIGDQNILKKISYSPDYFLIKAKFADELTKKPIPNIVVVLLNREDKEDYVDASPGFKKGTYNMLVEYGKQYELTLEPRDSSGNLLKNFDYSIKKTLLDLRGIPMNGSFDRKKQIEVEFLLPKKVNSSMDSLFSKFAVAKMSYSSYLNELAWDKDYSDAIKEATSSLIKQIDKEKQLKEKGLEIRQEQQQKKYLYGIIGIIVVITCGAIFAFFRQKKLKDLVNLKKVEAEQQKEIAEHQRHLVQEKQNEILDSINYAERIQRSFLASKQLLDENLENYFVYFQPKDVVSGDFYWASKLGNGNFALVTADSTGHGVPGAIMSILNITCLENAVKEGNSEPSEIFNHTRINIIDRLKKDGSADGGKDGMDASLISFDFKTNKLIYVAANNPVWIVREKQILEFAPNKMPVGKHDRDFMPFTQHEVHLQKGDMVYTLTDGMPDQFGGPLGKKYMYKRLKELLISISNLSMNEQKGKLQSSLNDWKGTLEQVDDVCLIGIKI